jgi:hypothetical protein
MLQAKTVCRLAEEASEIFYPAQVAANRGLSIVAALEFFQHDLAKMGYKHLLCPTPYTGRQIQRSPGQRLCSCRLFVPNVI